LKNIEKQPKTVKYSISLVKMVNHYQKRPVLFDKAYKCQFHPAFCGDLHTCFNFYLFFYRFFSYFQEFIKICLKNMKKDGALGKTAYFNAAIFKK
jgi:hypothetical protein